MPSRTVSRPLRAKPRRLSLVVLAIALALALAGCSDFYTPPTATQQHTIGDVDIATDVCLDGFGANSNSTLVTSSTYSPSSDCASDAGGQNSIVSGGEEGELLLGYLVPNGSTAPSSLTSPDLTGVSFAQDEDYSDWLAANETTPDGLHWVGYMSDDFTISTAEQIHVDADFSLPAGFGGAPYQGPFATQEVVGDRVDGPSPTNASVTLDPARPLNCAEITPGASPEPDIATTGCANDTASVSVNTNDLTVAAPATAITAAAGTTATVPFSVQFAGPADPTATFALSASTDAAGATASPADAQLAPADNSATTENVAVPLPTDLTPGTYHVTLTAQDSDAACTDAAQCARQATATITVTAPAPTTANGGGTVGSEPSQQPTPAPKLATVSQVRLAGTMLRLCSPFKAKVGAGTCQRRALHVSFQLSSATKVELAVQRARPHKRWLTVGSVVINGHAGLNHRALGERFHSETLTSGRYRVAVMAERGSVWSNAQGASFTVEAAEPSH